MTRWLPFPLYAAALVLAWVLLNGSLSPGVIALGIVLAIAASATLVRLSVPRGRPRRLRATVQLLVVVLVEIVRSNNAVARIILGARSNRTSGFVRIPLDMRNPYGLAALACIVTATPGTIWVEYDSANSTVLLHVLDLVDEEVWVRIIKDRYETRLMEIFR